MKVTRIKTFDVMGSQDEWLTEEELADRATAIAQLMGASKLTISYQTGQYGHRWASCTATVTTEVE